MAGHRKPASTNSINRKQINATCGISFTLETIGGRWKINILSYLLNEGKLRYSDLKKKLTGISERMLTASLKQLEKDGLVQRTVYHEVPLRVEYELTALGMSLQQILTLMDQWGEEKMPRPLI